MKGDKKVEKNMERVTWLGEKKKGMVGQRM